MIEDLNREIWRRHFEYDDLTDLKIKLEKLERRLAATPLDNDLPRHLLDKHKYLKEEIKRREKKAKAMSDE